MKKLAIFNTLLLHITMSTGSHSIWAFSTFIIGDTPFPEFSVVVMLDDIQLFYYDSDVQKLIYRQCNAENEDAEQKDAGIAFGDQYMSMKRRALTSKHQLNSTQEIHVQQRLVGCELLDGDTSGPLRSLDAFNTVNNEELFFSLQQKTLQSEGLWPTLWNHLERGSVEWLFENVYSPICIKTLRSYLHIKKNYVMRKVKPRVRLLQKTLPDSGGIKVTCLATGFYPRHINLTLLRDGQPVSDHQITGGELLPNGDGTYQMRKSLEVSAEELKHQYTCTAEHMSLDNKLNITMNVDPGADPVFAVPLVVVLSIALLLLCVAGTILVIVKCCRRRAAPPRVYAPDTRRDQQQKQHQTLLPESSPS